jgi:hypothetical protein
MTTIPSGLSSIRPAAIPKPPSLHSPPRSPKGHAPARVLRLPADTLPTRATLEAANVATLAIFTGDGTVNAQVAQLHGWSGAVLVLPGGTQNLLAKALHGDVDPPTIAARLGRGELRRSRRPAVETSTGHALVEVLAGPGATWADVREGVRDMDLSTIASALGEAVRSTAGGASVSVSEPSLGKPEGYRAVRIDADDGTLTLDGYDAQDWADLAAHGVSMLVKRDFRQGRTRNWARPTRGLHQCRADRPDDRWRTS